MPKNYLNTLILSLLTTFAFGGTPIDSLAKLYDVNVNFPDSVYISRLKSLNTQIDLTYNKEVKNAIDYFAERRRSFVKKVLVRKNLYFEIFEKKLREHEMPDEIKYLSVIESGLNPSIRSGAGAIGLWQFMPSTGKMFKLNQDYYIDDRMNPDKATEAACLYLKSLYKMFGDWQLALASYNCGPGNVRKAIRRSGYKETFWEIYDYLPKETRFYVPKFIAINYMMNFPLEHNISVDRVEYPMETDTIIINQYFNLDVFAKGINFCIEDLTKLNPEIKRKVIPETHKGYVLKVPKDLKPFIDSNRKVLMDSALKKSEEKLAYTPSVPKAYSYENKYKYIYKVRSGDALSLIAGKYNVTVGQLKYWNNLSSSRINVGQKLNIYKDPSYFKKYGSTPTPTVSSAATPKPKPLPGSKTYIVKSGDSLWKISNQYGVPVETLKKLNGLTNNNIDVGQTIILKR